MGLWSLPPVLPLILSSPFQRYRPLWQSRPQFQASIFKTFTPIPRQLLAGNFDAISCSLTTRSCQHDRRSFVSHSTSDELSFGSAKPMKERRKSRLVVWHGREPSLTRQMTQEFSHGLESS